MKYCLQFALAAETHYPVTPFLSFHFHVSNLAVPYPHDDDERDNVDGFHHIPPKPFYHRTYRNLANT